MSNAIAVMHRPPAWTRAAYEPRSRRRQSFYVPLQSNQHETDRFFGDSGQNSFDPGILFTPKRSAHFKWCCLLMASISAAADLAAAGSLPR
jgi:hypothetical protein